MIDTVAITIPEGDFKILNHNRFSPNTENLWTPPYIKVTGKPFKAVCNPTQKDKEIYGYLPRLTIYKAVRRNGFEIFLRIEFSIPKLLYGNNFDEVEESDFDDICWELKNTLFVMGVEISNIKILTDAATSTIHYSKNIILTDGTIPYSYLNEFRKINVNQQLDTNQSDFRNEGHAVRYRSNSYEVVLYDKLKDLEQAKKSEKLAIEKNNYSQLSLFDSHLYINPFEVIRLEIRLGNRKKIKQVLAKYEFMYKKLTFKDLYSKNLSQKILLETINDIENSYPIILKADVRDDNEFIAKIQLNNPNLSLSQILKYLGLKNALESMGTREFRKVTERFGKNNWYRLNKCMKDLDFGKSINVFDVLRKALVDFEAVRLVKLKHNL